MLKGGHRLGGTLVLVLGCAVVSPAHAHFVLLKPDSWLKEDGLGGPQKGAPCGPGNTDPVFGDNVTPVPTSGKVTTFHAGETIMVQWQTTIPHPGYFRISLAANRDDFKEPLLDDPTACSFNLAAVPTGPHDNVLMDGISANATMQQVTLPNTPCDKCTLQVIDVMQDHGGGSCFYHHCADLKILPADGTAGAGAGGAGSSGTGGSGAAGAGTSGTGTAGAGGKGAAGTSGTAGVGALAGSGAGGKAASGGVGGSTGTGGVGTGGPVTTGAAGINSGSAGSGGVPTGGQPPAGKKSGCAVSQPGVAASTLPVSFVLGLGLGTLRLRRRARQLPPRT